MLTYNTKLERLILPEYGRNIQKMVEHCLTIEDREERTRCAQSIFRCVCTLLPGIKGVEEEELRLWDQLMIMSGFKLDIDYPGAGTFDELREKPEPVPYNQSVIKHRQYGKTMQGMIERVNEVADGDERMWLIECLANHMKKTIIAATGEEVDDEKIFEDLRILSHGNIMIDASQLKLQDYVVPAAPVGSKKKKKKK